VPGAKRADGPQDWETLPGGTLVSLASGARGRVISKVTASGRYVHEGGICQGGTACVATGQDRRLGDCLTNAVDQNGCVFIATGDTRLLESAAGGPLPTARPLFIKQSSGLGRTGKTCG
jgi:hypothetical protein